MNARPVTQWQGPGLRWSRIAGMPRSATAALHAMGRALDGQPPPCADDPEAWTSPTSPAQAADAIDVCCTCPVVAACHQYGAALRSSSPRGADGVWGGRMHGRYEAPQRPGRETEVTT